MPKYDLPSIKQVRSARKKFKKIEMRGMFYYAAIDLINLSRKGNTELTVTESLAILLYTWNRAYYRYRTFDRKHLRSIEKVVRNSDPVLKRFRNRNIGFLDIKHYDSIMEVFDNFEYVVGPVGAAKSLHLLAPRFFPIWDRKIAQSYGLRLGSKYTNSDKYIQFMEIVKQQWIKLGGEAEFGKQVLKAIDEYNYVRFTLKL